MAHRGRQHRYGRRWGENSPDVARHASKTSRAVLAFLNSRLS